MIVVDSNVLAYLYVPGEHTPAAEALLDAASAPADAAAGPERPATKPPHQPR